MIRKVMVLENGMYNEHSMKLEITSIAHSSRDLSGTKIKVRSMVDDIPSHASDITESFRIPDGAGKKYEFRPHEFWLRNRGHRFYEIMIETLIDDRDGFRIEYDFGFTRERYILGNTA